MKTTLSKTLLTILLCTLASLSSFSQGKLRIINSDTVITLTFKDAKWLNSRFKEMEDSLSMYKFKYMEKHEDYDSLKNLHLQRETRVEAFKIEFEEEKKVNDRLRRYVKQDDIYRTASVGAAWFTIIGLTMWFMVLAGSN